MHAALWATPEAVHEVQPQRHATRNLWLAADARVDNRAELIEALATSTEQPLHTDADLLLAAHERWGTDLVDHVVGDFAFALWDADAEELVLARDPVGVRPLFVARTPTGVVASSALPAVLEALGVRPSTDEAYLAGFLHGLPPRDRTVWSGIERLAPGHRLRVGQSHDVVERYWRPSLEPLMQPLTDSVAQVQESFDEAVRCRLRTPNGIAVDLSGGLDSSTITATAAGIAAVRPVSLVYRADGEAFELDHVEAVCNHLGLEPTLIEADDLATLDPVGDIRVHREPLFSIDATDTAALYDAVANLGCAVSLTGVGGDELLDSTATCAADRNRWSARVSILRWAAGRPGGLVAGVVRSRRRHQALRERPWLRVPRPDWPTVTLGRSGHAVNRLTGIEAPWNPPAFELTDRLAAERGVEVRYPFLDRRLIELVLRLPESHIRTGDDPRGLHRRAFGARLPPSVAGRIDKAEFTASFKRRMDSVTSEDAAAALGDRIDAGRLPESGPWLRWAALSAGVFLARIQRCDRETPDTLG